MDSPHLRKYGLRNPKNFCSWNPQSGKIFIMEYGIQLKESSIPLTVGTQNAESRIQVPLTKIWNLVTGIGNPGRGIQNPESRFPYLGGMDGGQSQICGVPKLRHLKNDSALTGIFFFFVVVIIIIRGSTSNINMNIFFSLLLDSGTSC